jgi:hypothetical protein
LLILRVFPLFSFHAVFISLVFLISRVFFHFPPFLHFPRFFISRVSYLPRFSHFPRFRPGIAGAVIFVILLVLLVWMICVRATKRKATNEKAQLGPGAEVAHRWKNLCFLYIHPI